MTTRPQSVLRAEMDEARIHHDVRVVDRRHNNMQHVLDALQNCITDLCTFASSPVIIAGVAYSVADRLTRLSAELEAFKARDLVNLREQARS